MGKLRFSKSSIVTSKAIQNLSKPSTIKTWFVIIHIIFCSFLKDVTLNINSNYMYEGLIYFL